LSTIAADHGAGPGQWFAVPIHVTLELAVLRERPDGGHPPCALVSRLFYPGGPPNSYPWLLAHTTHRALRLNPRAGPVHDSVLATELAMLYRTLLPEPFQRRAVIRWHADWLARTAGRAAPRITDFTRPSPSSADDDLVEWAERLRHETGDSQLGHLADPLTLVCARLVHTYAVQLTDRRTSLTREAAILRALADDEDPR
jgi:hypothetical protein